MKLKMFLIDVVKHIESLNIKNEYNLLYIYIYIVFKKIF